jgi:hypothetical protein
LFGISYLEVGLNLSLEVLCLLLMNYYVSQFLGLSWTVCCLLQKDYYVDWLPLVTRRKSVRIVNVLPGPRPR